MPIETIVEFRLKLDIIPVPGLCHGPRGINGYLSSDRTSIYVDQGHFENIEKRYHFTLAHEVGHLILHGDFYDGFASDEEWKEFHAHLASHDLGSAEYQANTFAGLVLVPEGALGAVARESFDALSEPVLKRYPDFDRTGEAFWSLVANEVGIRFNVSSTTARIRLENDGHWGTSP